MYAIRSYYGMDGAAYGARVWHNLVPMIRGYGGDAWDENGEEDLE